MGNNENFVIIRYITIFFIIVGMVISKKTLTSSMFIFILIFIINSQLRFFSLQKHFHKMFSFVIEIIFTITANVWIGGFLFTYLILLAIDSNVIFNKKEAIIFDIIIIIEGIVFSLNYGMENRGINLGVTILVIFVLYFTKDEKERKLKAQDLYYRIKISEENLKNANKELELYAASIEEITTLRERNRISREIHDSVGHALSTMVIQLGAVEKMIKKDPDAAEKITKNLRKFTQRSLDEVRMAVREIKPKEFEKFEGILNIQELINNFKKMTGVDVRLSFTKEKWSFNSDQSFVIYRIIQEFLSNSVRHGKATVIHIMMAYTLKSVVVTLKDNGIGSDGLVEGFGMKSMRERVGALGGYFEYTSKKGQGFLVRIEIEKQEKLKVHNEGDFNGSN